MIFIMKYQWILLLIIIIYCCSLKNRIDINGWIHLTAVVHRMGHGVANQQQTLTATGNSTSGVDNFWARRRGQRLSHFSVRHHPRISINRRRASTHSLLPSAVRKVRPYRRFTWTIGMDSALRRRRPTPTIPKSPNEPAPILSHTRKACNHPIIDISMPPRIVSSRGNFFKFFDDF